MTVLSQLHITNLNNNLVNLSLNYIMLIFVAKLHEYMNTLLKV